MHDTAPRSARRRSRFYASLAPLAVAAAVWLGGCATTAQPVDTQQWRSDLDRRLRADVEALADEFPGRSIHRPELLEGAAAWLEGRLRAMGHEPARDVFTVRARGSRERPIENPGPREIRNILVEIEGTESPGTIIVLGAHYDAVPQTPGADDNASGVAVGLALAEYFRGRPQPITLRFEFYPNEEFSRADWGSLRRARASREAGEDVRAMLSLEMLGYFTEGEVDPQVRALTGAIGVDTPGNETFVAVATQPRFEALVERIAGDWPGPVEAVPVAARLAVPLAGRSDNWAYWQADYPAAIVTDTSFMRNPNYHTPADTPATLDYARMALVTENLRTVVERLAADPPPTVLEPPMGDGDGDDDPDSKD